MLIDFRTLFPKYGITPKGVIQVGAHWAEEHDIYVEMGVQKIVYIEPCMEAFNKMLTKFGGLGQPDKEYGQVNIDGITLFRVACGVVESKMTMQISHNNQGQSNSLLAPKLHLQQHPEVVFTDTEIVNVAPLDNLPFDRSDYNVLVIDTQGFDGIVLKGAKNLLKGIDLIYTEINRDETYEGNMLIGEIDEFLKPYGFERTETYWPSHNWSWGDCCFVKIK